MTTYTFKVGDEIKGPVRAVTPQRIEWYDSALLSVCSNELRRAGPNIHTSEQFAKDQGMPGANADGMIMANYCSEMMIDAFGFDYLERGELRTKFIKPVLINVELHTKGRIKSIDTQSNGNVRYALDVWCEDQNGVKLVDGEAAAEISAA